MPRIPVLSNDALLDRKVQIAFLGARFVLWDAPLCEGPLPLFCIYEGADYVDGLVGCSIMRRSPPLVLP